MEAVTARLAESRVATLRYQFPYMEKGRRAPDRPPALVETVLAAVRHAQDLFPDLPLFAGGKSMGGRMTSLAASEHGLPEVEGLVFLGFPLHAPKTPGTERAEHLENVLQSMLFVQGTRDNLARLDLLRPVCESLGDRATLHEVESGDHSFRVLKRSGRSDEEALVEVCDVVTSWMDRRVPTGVSDE